MCTNFKVPVAEDGTVVIGRSLEFPTLMPTALAVLPHDHAGRGVTPEGGAVAKSWTARYGIVGMAAFGHADWLLDGMSTAGLSAHLLYMPRFAHYPTYRGDGTDVSQVDVIAYLLGTCATLDEVRAAVPAINIWGFDPGMGFPPPIHVLVHDAQGSLAIEFRPEGTTIVDNPTSVATNSPYLDWHLTNLDNYAGLSASSDEKTTYGSATFQPLAQGEGLRGLPGDYTGPSRFVRAFAMLTLSDRPADGAAAEQFALHMLNAFDIPIGLIKEEGPGGALVDEVTVWDSIANLTGQRYAYRTVTDPTVYVVDLAQVDFDAPARIQELSWAGGFTPVTV
jgi:choloylglycine hydrolase